MIISSVYQVHCCCEHPILPYWPLQGGATFYISLVTCTSVLIRWHTKSWFSNWHLLKDENFCMSSAHWYLHEDVSLISWIPLLFQVLTWAIPCWKPTLPKQCACFFFLHSPADLTLIMEIAKAGCIIRQLGTFSLSMLCTGWSSLCAFLQRILLEVIS